MFYKKKEQKITKHRIFRFISTQKKFTKQDLADNLEISFPTVGKYINDFLDIGIIKNLGFYSNKKKYKTLTYEYNPNGIFSIGIKIEINKLSFLIINLKGDEIKKTEIYKNFINNSNSLEYIIEKLKNFLISFPEKEKIKGIGVSLPRVIDNENKEFKVETNIQIFSKDINLLETEFNLPIFLINEANAGVFYEYILNDYSYNNLAYISIGDGISSGIITNNKIYYGKSSKAGEIGHITVVDDGKKCSCGNKGCLDQYCSNPAFIKDFENAFNLNNLNLYEIFYRNLHLDEKGKNIILNYLNYLSRSIKTLQLLFDLDKIIIGGNIVYYKHLFKMEEVLKVKVCNSIFSSNKNILEFSKFKNNSSLFGAAFFPLKEFLY